MKPAPCPRLFEVEAARDGRLRGAELSSFERHLSQCSACSSEAEALESLAQALRTAGARKPDELRVRRERNRLLSAFDHELVEPRARGWGRWLLWPAPVAALVLSLFIFWPGGPAELAPSTPEVTSSAVVRAESGAVWSQRTEAQLDELRLERGSLWIHVEHSSAGKRRVLVLLPDGDLEDIGTTFSVSADEGRTTRVVVEEGSVLLRLRGRSPLVIGAGETWSPDVRGAASTSTSAPPLPAPEPTPVSPVSPRARSAPSERAQSASSGASRRPLTSALTADPADDFRAATGLLRAGEHATAAAAFASFLVKHPSDPRAEDAAYLRVIALRRNGDRGSMKQAAEEYLRHYPAGFRRAEVETLSR